MLHHLARVADAAVWNGWTGICGVVGRVILREPVAYGGDGEADDNEGPPGGSP